MLILKRGVSKLQISFGFFVLLLLLITNAFADVTKENIVNDNMLVISETKNNIKVTFYPLYIGLVDKEYNLTIENLESNQRELDIGAFFNAVSGGIDTLIPGSIKLSYLTDLTKIIDDYSKVCTDREVTLSAGEPNQTIGTVTICTEQNNPKSVSFKGWKEYPTNEARDKQKQELVLQKTNENGKIVLDANGKAYLNLKFKTKVTNKLDGTYGNNGQFGLLLDGVLFHPTFNTAYNKRYLINITANDPIDTNYTHNITFGFTGNSGEIGGGTKFTFGANNTVLACDNLHVIFNGTTEIAAEVSQCNSSSFSIYFRNQNNITRNGTALNQYEIYYDPVGTNYQRPDEYVQVWLPGSDSFDKGFNSTRWLNDTSGSGLSYWVNTSNGNGLMYLDGGADPDDGCFRGANNPGNNITQNNAGMQFLMTRAQTSGVCNSAWGLNDRTCGNSPNTDSHGIFFKDDPPGFCPGLAGRTANTTAFLSGVNDLGRLGDMGNWRLLEVNYTANTRSTVRFNNASGSPLQESFTTNVPNGTHPLRVLMRVEGTDDRIYLDNFIVYQIVNSSPTYDVFQENRTVVQPAGLLSVQACTAENRSMNQNTYNLSCIGSYPSTCGSNGDRLSCDDGIVENLNFQKDRFAGVHVQAFNKSIDDCEAISDIFLCYEWWVTNGTLTNCLVAVDADGNASYTNVTTTCPGTTANPGVTCTNVTSLENWGCGNFFNSSETKAVARNELSRSNNGPMNSLSTDVLLFNVSYIKDEKPIVILVNPPNGLINDSRDYTFSSNVTDNIALQNATLYHNISGLWTANQTITISGKANSTTFGVANIVDGSYEWNVGVCDADNNCAFATNNFTFRVGTAPTIARVDINSTDPTTNNTNQNITIYPRGVSDPNGDFVTNITNWFLNNNTVTILNLPFDINTAKVVKDYSGEVGNGTPINITWVPNGIVGGAYKFSRSSGGENQSVTFTPTNDFHFTNNSFAIEVWFNLTNLPTGTDQYEIISKRSAAGGSGWRLDVLGSIGGTQDVLDFLINRGTDVVMEQLLSNISIGAGKLVHIIINWNEIIGTNTSSNLTMWINGIARQNTLLGKGGNTNNFNITVGDYFGGGGRFNGIIDNIRIYNRSLSDEQIRLLNSSRGDWLTIVSQETQANENWSACVTPNDATQDGAAVCSQNILITS